MLFPAFITVVLAFISLIVWMTSKGLPWFLAIIITIVGLIALIVAFLVIAVVMSTGATGIGSRKSYGAD